jgi:hypothetical protein
MVQFAGSDQRTLEETGFSVWIVNQESYHDLQVAIQIKLTL